MNCRYICFSIFLLTISLIILYNYIIISDTIDSSILKYSTLNRCNCQNRVVVSLSANKETISQLKPVIKQLLEQDVKVDEICVNTTPDVSGKTIPEYVKQSSMIYKSGKNYGDKHNFIPTVKREKDGNTIIMPLQSGVIIPKNYISSILEQMDKSDIVKSDSGQTLAVKMSSVSI